MNAAFWQGYKRAYEGLPREAWILAGINLVNASGTMVVFFLTLYLTQRLGFTASRAGQVVGAFGVGMLLGTVLGGKVADKIGTRAVQKAGLIASGTFLIILGFEREVPLLFVFVFLSGVSNAALFPANASAMAEICGPSDRSRGFVLNRLANNLGATVGPVAGGLLARLDYRYLFWGDGLTSLLAALALFVFLPKVHKRTESTGRNSTPPATSWKKDGVFWRLLLCSFGSTLIFSQLYAAFPLYLHSAYRLPVNLIGFVIAINPLMIVLAQMVVTHGVERFPRARVAAVGTTASCGRLRPPASRPWICLFGFFDRGLDGRRDAIHADSTDDDLVPRAGRITRNISGAEQPGLWPGHRLWSDSGNSNP